MNISIGARWEAYVEELLKTGRYASASEIMREGLRMVEERERKLDDLRATIQASLARGGSKTGDEVMESVRKTLDKWEAENAARNAA